MIEELNKSDTLINTMSMNVGKILLTAEIISRWDTSAVTLTRDSLITLVRSLYLGAGSRAPSAPKELLLNALHYLEMFALALNHGPLIINPLPSAPCPLCPLRDRS